MGRKCRIKSRTTSVETEFITERLEQISEATSAASTSPANAVRQQFIQKRHEGGLGFAPRKEALSDDARHGKDEYRSELQQHRKHGSPAGLAQILRAQHALHVDLVHAPVKNAAVDRPRNDAPERIIRVVVGFGYVHRGRRQMGQCMPPADAVRPMKSISPQPRIMMALCSESV